MHEHIIGTYEKALIYFKGSSESVDGNKKLKDIAIFHQLSEHTLTKTSAELYDIMMKACSTKDYWVPEDNRHNTVMSILGLCEKEYLIRDDEILKNAREDKSNKRMIKRLYKFDKWKEMIKYK